MCLLYLYTFIPNSQKGFLVGTITHLENKSVPACLEGLSSFVHISEAEMVLIHSSCFLKPIQNRAGPQEGVAGTEQWAPEPAGTRLYMLE